MQQTTIQLGASHPLRNMTGLAKAIALPAEFAPQRFPSYPALERTAVMGFNQPSTLSVPTGANIKIALARQAAWPVWADQDINGQTYSLSLQLMNHSSSGLIETAEVNPAPVKWTVGVQPVGAYNPAFTSGSTPLLNYPVLAYDMAVSSIPFIFVPTNAGLYFTVGNSTNTTTANATNVRIWYNTWDAPGQAASSHADLVSTAGNVGAASGRLSVTSGTWIQIVSVETVTTVSQPFNYDFVNAMVVGGTAVYTGSAANNGSWAITGASGSSLFPLFQPAEFANSQLPWFSARVTAAAMLGTNVTQVLNKAGTVLGGRLAPEVLSMWAVTPAYINGLHPAEKAWLPLETGVYTYCPPSSDLAQFWDYTLNTGNLSNFPGPCPVYRLDNLSMVNIIYLNSSTAIENLAITSSWHIEFRTSSALFQIGLSGLPLESLHQAQLALAAAGFFFDNPDHKAILAKVVAAAKSMAPVGMAIVKAVNPPLAKAIKRARKTYARLTAPQPQPPPVRPRRPRGPGRRGTGKGGGGRRIPLPRMSPAVPTTSSRNSGMLPGGPQRQKMASGLDMYLRSRR